MGQLLTSPAGATVVLLVAVLRTHGELWGGSVKSSEIARLEGLAGRLDHTTDRYYELQRALRALRGAEPDKTTT